MECAVVFLSESSEGEVAKVDSSENNGTCLLVLKIKCLQGDRLDRQISVLYCYV